MKRLVALGISIGVLAGLFTWVAVTVTHIGSWTAPLVVWVGFAAWAVFYAAGGRTGGLVKALANLLAGRWSDRVGRKQILVAGWLAGIPCLSS